MVLKLESGIINYTVLIHTFADDSASGFVFDFELGETLWRYQANYGKDTFVNCEVRLDYRKAFDNCWTFYWMSDLKGNKLTDAIWEGTDGTVYVK